MTIQRAFINDVKWLSLAQLFLRLKGFLVIPLMTHTLGAWDYGVWTQVAAVGSLLIPFVIWGMNRGYIRYASGKSADEQLQLYYAWIIAISAATLLVSIPVVLFHKEISGFVLGEVEESSNLIFFAIGFCFSNSLYQVYRAWLQASGQSRLFSLVLVLQAVASLLAIAVYLIVDGTLMLLVSLTIGTDFLLIGILLTQQFRRYGGGRPDFERLKLVFFFSYPLMPAAFASIGINWGDRIVLLQYVSIFEIGIYNLAHGVAMMMVQTVTQPVRSYYPARATALFNEGDLKGVQKLYRLSAGTLFAVYVPSIIGLAFVSSNLLSVLAPLEFIKGAALMPLLFAGYAIDRMCSYDQLQLEWRHRQGWITISLFGCLGMNIALNYALVPTYGLQGAGVASLLSFFARWLFIAGCVRRETLLNINYSFVFRITVSALIMGGVLYMFHNVQMGFPLGLAILFQLALGMTVYFSLLMIFRVVSFSSLQSAYLHLKNQ